MYYDIFINQQINVINTNLYFKKKKREKLSVNRTIVFILVRNYDINWIRNKD